MSQRRACRVVGAHRRTIRQQRRVREDEPHVRERLRPLAAARPRWGYRRLPVLLRRELGTSNHQRVQRLDRLEGLAVAVRRHKRKRVARVPRGMPTVVWQPGEAWAIDFMQDVLANGRRFRTLHVLDTLTRECLAIEVDTALPGQRVVRLLDQLRLGHGTPTRITLDNGPEFTGQALDAWASQHHVTLDFIDPGKPMQKGYRESFNGTFRDECLTIHWFRTLADARRLIEDWRESYNTERPHSALCGHTPAAYALHYQAVGSLASWLAT